jgi:hypothetical protein
MISLLVYVFRQLLMEAPAIIIYSGCLVAALLFWRRAPAVSLYVLLACGFKLALFVIYPVTWWYLRTVGIGANPTVRVLFNIGWSLADSLFVVLLVVAAYAGRKQFHRA